MTDHDRKAKLVEYSLTEKTEIVLPQHANALGTAFGGTVLAWIDICAAVVAQRHCGGVAVTASIDQVHFLRPIRIGDVVRLVGRINAVFGTSMEVEVVVETEDRSTQKRMLCADALLTFVAMNDQGKPTRAPALTFSTDEERQRAEQASERRQNRLRRS